MALTVYQIASLIGLIDLLWDHVATEKAMQLYREVSIIRKPKSGFSDKSTLPIQSLAFNAFLKNRKEGLVPGLMEMYTTER